MPVQSTIIVITKMATSSTTANQQVESQKMAFVRAHNSVVTGGTLSYENNPSFRDPRDGRRKFRKVGSKHFNPEGGGIMFL